MTLEGRGISSELNTIPGLIVWKEAEEVILFHLAGSSSTSIFYMEKHLKSLKIGLTIKFTPVFPSFQL